MEQRLVNRWGTQSFQSQEDAEEFVRPHVTPDKPWYIWRLSDGTFDYSSRAEPGQYRWYPDDAELVVTVRDTATIPDRQEER